MSGETFVLPRIIPCVLYNGEDKWTAPVELKDLYDDIGENEEYLLNFKYILIDIYRYKPDDLYSIGNVISSAFYLDTAGKEMFWERLKILSESLKNMDEDSWKIFMIWVSKIFVMDKRTQVELEGKILKKEEYDMGTLATIRQDIFNDGVKEGFNNGKVVGIKEGFNDGKIVGIREGIIASVKSLLKYKLKNAFDSKQIEIIDNTSLKSWKR